MTGASLPILLVGALLAGCATDDTTGNGATASAPHRVPIQNFLPDTTTATGAAAPGATPPASLQAPAGSTGEGGGVETRANDPSAPLDTPLCGRAEREMVAIDTAVSPSVAAGAGACAATACFDPLTDTFIGADGARHVCQE